MGYSRAKTRFAAELTLQGIVQNCPEGRCVTFFTFTMRDVCSKGEAEHRLEPFKDLVRRRGGNLAGVWERQVRGAWHVHGFVDLYFDVRELRPWMVERGWGQQMFLKRLDVKAHFNGQTWIVDVSSVKWALRYILKYVTKSFADDEGNRMRPFFCTARVKAATVRFSWRKEVNPSSYLHYWGRALFLTLYGRQPKFHELDHVMRLGLEDTDWASVDPWCRWALGP